MNRLMAFPVAIVLLALVWPVVMLDGGALYLEFVRHNATSCVVVSLCWSVVLYWVTRRVAELALWRGSGRKLALREGHPE